MSEAQAGPERSQETTTSAAWAEVFARSPTPMGLVIDLVYVVVNDALCELLGRPAEEIIGVGVGEFLEPSKAAELEAALRRPASPDVRVHLEASLRRGDGEERRASLDVVIVPGRPEVVTALVQGADVTDLHRARDELTASERWYRNLLTNISDTVSLTDAHGSLLFTTGQQAQALGYSEDYWNDVVVLDLVHPDDLGDVLSGWEEGLQRPGVEITREVRLRESAGTWADVVVTGVNLIDDPDVGGIVITSRNITALRRAQRLSSSQAAVLELIARGAPLVDVFERCVELVEENGMGGRSSIYLLDGERLEMRAGRAPAELNDFMREAPRHPPRCLCDTALATGGPVLLHDLDDGSEIHPGLREVAERVGLRAGWSQPILSVSTAQAVGTLSTIYEVPHTPDRFERQVGELACSLAAIAIERVDNESRLAHQALHDGLTGLPNRTLLLDRLDHALARRGRSASGLAVLFCDLDRFKVVNDSLGHGVGDQLLVAFADRLRDTIDPGDTVARFGGDEFVVLLEATADVHEPLAVAERIAAALAAPFVLPAGQEVYLTASVGLAVSGDHTSGDDWLRDADAAMYRAKERGRNRLELFDTDMRDAAVIRLQVENDLRRAVARDELVVHYQPVIDLDSGRICGAEALVRWEHPLRGLLPPDDFIGVAEETGIIDELGRHILDRAVGDLSRVIDRTDGRRFQLGVNLSARQLSAPDLDLVVDRVCRTHGWPHQDLLLEITETALTQGIEGPLELLGRIHQLGVELAIDDFGTGHSSLTRLGRMPVDQVKIDRSFVAAIAGPDERLVRMVDAVVAVAAALDLRIAAEGVETQEQLDYVRRSRCGLAQGYLFAKPLPLDEFEQLLAADPRW